MEFKDSIADTTGDPFESDPLAKHSKDIDQSWDSRHHSLGKGSTQAAPGNHTHPLNEIVPFGQPAGPPGADGVDGSKEYFNNYFNVTEGILIEYLALTTTSGDTDYLGDVTLTSNQDPDIGWTRIICEGNGYITPENDGVAHFSAYLNFYGDAGLPADSYVRWRLTREPFGSQVAQDHTGYEDVEIKEFMSTLRTWMWMIAVNGGQRYSLWARLRRENSTADAGTVTLSSRQFKMHNFVVREIVEGVVVPDIDTLYKLIRFYNPWYYYTCNAVPAIAGTYQDDGKLNHDATYRVDTTGFQVRPRAGQPEYLLTTWEPAPTFTTGDRALYGVNPYSADLATGYTFAGWVKSSTYDLGVGDYRYNAPNFNFGTSINLLCSNGLPGWRVFHNNIQVASFLGGCSKSNYLFVAISYDYTSKRLKFFVGASKVYDIECLTVPAGVSPSFDVCRGASNANTGGNCQHVAFWDKELPEADILAIYNSGASTA